MEKAEKCPQKIRERAVRMIFEHPLSPTVLEAMDGLKSGTLVRIAALHSVAAGKLAAEAN